MYSLFFLSFGISIPAIVRGKKTITEPRVIADPDNYEARANIMWAGMVAHNNTCGVGRSQDWNSHNIEHELSALYEMMV